MSHPLDRPSRKHIEIGGTLIKVWTNARGLFQLQYRNGNWSRCLNPDDAKDQAYIRKYFKSLYAALVNSAVDNMPKVFLPNGEFIMQTPYGTAIRGNSQGLYTKDVAATLGVTEDEINQYLDEDSLS